MDRFGGSGERDSGNGTGTADLIDAVRELITLMGRGGITELDLTTGGVTIRLRGNGGGHAVAALPATTGDDSKTPEQATGHFITAPMIGTYYAAPAAGEAPFVQAGDEVEVGQTIGIIEAMKIMNEIECELAGRVREVHVENGQAVEYGQPLMVIDPL